MRWDGEVCIVSGDNRAWGSSNNPKTVIELWCRSREGHSVVLLVNGLSPYLEISESQTIGNQEPTKSLEVVSQMSEVTEPPILVGEKLSQDGKVRNHYRVMIKDTRFVRNLRKRLIEIGWKVTSADILFVHRLLLDLDLGPHIATDGEVLWAGPRAPSHLSLIHI